MAYLIPDLTGENPSYRCGNDAKRVVIGNQRIELFNAVYQDSLVVTMTGTVNTTFVLGYDYTFKDEDYDYDAMGRAQLLDRNFNKKLVKSFTVIKPFIDPYTLNCTYQQLYPNTIRYILENPTENIEITPEVLWDLMKRVQQLELVTTPVEDVHAAAERSPMLLPPDPNKEYKGNVIDGEVWSIDTTVGRKVIYPVAGSFFRDSLVIVKGTYTSVEDARDVDRLLEGTDYVISGVDAYGIHHTSNTSGVYHIAVLTCAYVGNVTVKYHSYGGIPTQYDVRAIYESLSNLYRYISEAQLLTSTTVGNTTAMIELRSRINALEDTVRILANQGRPSYGDITHGEAVVKKISAADTEFHWWTIAELYKVAGSDTIFTAQIGHFQVNTVYTGIMLDFTVAVNIAKKGHKLEVKTLSSSLPQGYVPFEDDSELSNVIRPQLRIIWNENSIEGSGIFLQFGMRLKGIAEEIMGIADLSGRESCWKLVTHDDISIRPEDNGILLPSGNHYWDTTNTDSRQESTLVPVDEAHVVWAGSMSLNRPVTGLRHILLDHFLESEVDLSRLKTVSFLMEEYQGSRFRIDMPVLGTDTSIAGATSFTYSNRPVSLIYQATRNVLTKKVTMEIYIEVSAGLQSNRLDLRYVLVNS